MNASVEFGKCDMAIVSVTIAGRIPQMWANKGRARRIANKISRAGLLGFHWPRRRAPVLSPTHTLFIHIETKGNVWFHIPLNPLPVMASHSPAGQTTPTHANRDTSYCRTCFLFHTHTHTIVWYVHLDACMYVCICMWRLRGCQVTLFTFVSSQNLILAEVGQKKSYICNIFYLNAYMK